jgi:cytosine/adenosine deaminase-related metal-dependent hydrolase
VIRRIRARWILVYDPDACDHRLLTGGRILVDGSTITAIGTAEPDDVVDEDIDLGGCLIMPGFIDLDALADIDHAILDSWTATRGELDWSADYAAHRRRAVFSAAERRTIRRYAFAQLLLHGVTTAMPIAAETHSDWAETFEDAVGMAEEANALGLRFVGGPSYRSGVTTVDEFGVSSVHWDERLGEQGFDGALKFLDWVENFDSPIVSGALLPCRIQTVTDAIIRDTLDESVSRGVRVRLHALQGLDERDRIAERSGLTPLRLLEKLGALGPNLLIPHGIYVDHTTLAAARDAISGATPTERPGIEVLADAGVSIAHCALTSARYGTALNTFGAYRTAGVRLTLGTDSFPPDMVRSIDIGVNIAKVLGGRLDEAPVADYVRAGTLGGAAFLGRDDLGRLSPGAQADLVAYRLDDVRDGVVDDPIRTLTMNGSSRSASLSMIAGRIVMRDGALPGVDLSELASEAQELFDRMRAAYSERSPGLLPSEVLFPPVFSPA